MKSSHQLALGGLVVIVGGLVVYRLVKGGATALAATPAKVLAAINPTNPDNVFATAANAVTKAITGDSTTSLGSWLYDTMNPNAPKATDTLPKPSKMSEALVQQLGVGDKLTRADQAWLTGQLYGPDVQTADVDDAEQGQFFRAANPGQAAADRLQFAVKP